MRRTRTSLLIAKRRGSCRRRGATMVEVAFVLPIFFLMLLGAYECGRLSTLRRDLNSVAYDAARYATRLGATRQQTIEYASQELHNLGIHDAGISIEPAPEQATSDVTVRVNLPLGKYGWITPAIARHDQIASSCTLRVETAASPDSNTLRQTLTSASTSLTGLLGQ